LDRHERGLGDEIQNFGFAVDVAVRRRRRRPPFGGQDPALSPGDPVR
jgi:hypothetical protein